MTQVSPVIVSGEDHRFLASEQLNKHHYHLNLSVECL
jgi:hypothetical protein